MTEQSNPFESALVRTLVGLSGAIVCVVIGFLYFDGIIRWMLVGVAALDAVVTPYVLKQTVTEEETRTDPTA